ncbi:MAG: hypothetical protein ACREN2_14230 [Candidatus Dormibacteria bacterium]
MNRVIPMINAEWLKLSRRRGLMWLTLFLIAGSVVLANAVLSAYHASDPARYGPAGGLAGLHNSETLFGLAAALAAILIGATAGAQDVESGVFRSLAATGQSRVRLALVRIPGGLLVLVPILFLGYGLEVAAVFLLAGGTPTPDATTLLVMLRWLVALGTLNFTVGLGLASLLRSRAFAIGILVAWELAGSRIIDRLSDFGNWRVLSSTIATDRLLPSATDAMRVGESCSAPGACAPDIVTVSVAAALLVIAGWIVVATLAGVWRTATQEA